MRRPPAETGGLARKGTQEEWSVAGAVPPTVQEYKQRGMEMQDENPDVPHDPQSDGHYYEVRIEFDVTEDEDGDLRGVAAHVDSHVHHVPMQAVVDTLLLLCVGYIKDGMSERTFAEGVPDFVREGMTNAFVQMYLKQRVEAVAKDGVVMDAIHVPDDISGLLGMDD